MATTRVSRDSAVCGRRGAQRLVKRGEHYSFEDALDMTELPLGQRGSST